MNLTADSVFTQKLFIQIGTRSLIVAQPNRGVVFDELSLVGHLPGGGNLIGNEAWERSLQGADVELVFPFLDGKILNFEAIEQLLRGVLVRCRAIRALHEWRGFEIFLLLPHKYAELELLALKDVFTQNGALQVNFLSYKSGFADLVSSEFCVYLDIGAGGTRLTYGTGASLSTQALPFSGLELNKLLAEFCEHRHGVRLTDVQIEELKLRVMSSSDRLGSIFGVNVATGAPSAVELDADQLRAEIDKYYVSIGAFLKEKLYELNSAQLQALTRLGGNIVGGGSGYSKLSQILKTQTGFSFSVVSDAKWAALSHCLILPKKQIGALSIDPASKY